MLKLSNADQNLRNLNRLLWRGTVALGGQMQKAQRGAGRLNRELHEQ